MCQKQFQRNQMPIPRESHAGNCINEHAASIDMLIDTPANPTPALKELMSRRYRVNGNEPSFTQNRREPAAYIVTDNRGKRYLVFSDSVEHENAQMFGYEIKPLYE